MSDTKNAPIKNGDNIDINEGKRVFYFCAIWLPLMVAGHISALIIVASSTVPRVPKSAIKAYASCLGSAKTPAAKRRCKEPKAAKANGVSSKFLDVGPYPWIGAIVLFLAGLVFWIMQSRQDFEQLKEITALGTVFVNKNAALPAFMEKGLSTVIDKAAKTTKATETVVTSTMPDAGADSEKG